MANVIFIGTFRKRKKRDKKHERKTKKNTYRCLACNKKVRIISFVKKDDRCPFCYTPLRGGIIQEL